MAQKLWSKLENEAAITSPEVGAGGSVFGSPQFLSAKFGNGIKSQDDGHGCKFPTGSGNNIELNKGSIGIWIDADSSIEWKTCMLWDFCSATGGIQLYVIFSDHIYIAVRVIAGGVVKFTEYIISEEWYGGLLHLAVTWDREAGLSGGKSLIVKKNNSEIRSVSTTWPASGYGSYLYIGTTPDEASRSLQVIDDLQTYDDGKEDWSDYEVEGGDGGGGNNPSAPTGLLCNGQTNPTGVT